jgi:glucose-6-phosphate isomerase
MDVNRVDFKEINEYGFVKIASNSKNVIDEINEYSKYVNSNFENFVVVGIGGSSLGPKAVHTALNNQYYNEISGNTKIYFLENIDPDTFEELFEVINIEKTLFNVITKSGGTSETMAKFMILKARLGNLAKTNIVCTTDRENGNLIKIAKEEGYKTFFIPADVGGRFSELTPVGLLPAAISGIDIEKLILGAKSCLDDNLEEAKEYALIMKEAIEKGKNTLVFMPYSDKLSLLGDWFVQLWAESLGKKVDNEGNVINYGQLPHKSVGAIDQHSQVQLFAEGPNDKIFTFLEVKNFKNQVKIPKIYDEVRGISFLGGHTLNELISAEKFATDYALKKENRDTLTIEINEINEEVIGKLIMFFELATVFLGELVNIDPFNQPGVEEGKNATYALFGKEGYEYKLEELKDQCGDKLWNGK